MIRLYLTHSPPFFHRSNCPRCGFFDKNWLNYERWDGRLPEETRFNQDGDQIDDNAAVEGGGMYVFHVQDTHLTKFSATVGSIVIFKKSFESKVVSMLCPDCESPIFPTQLGHVCNCDECYASIEAGANSFRCCGVRWCESCLAEGGGAAAAALSPSLQGQLGVVKKVMNSQGKETKVDILIPETSKIVKGVSSTNVVSLDRLNQATTLWLHFEVLAEPGNNVVVQKRSGWYKFGHQFDIKSALKATTTTTKEGGGESKKINVLLLLFLLHQTRKLTLRFISK